MGAAFVARLGARAIPLDRSAIDLSIPERIGRSLGRAAPEWVVNCAAHTDVDGAEAEEDLARTVNGEAVGALAHWCRERSVPFLTYSTDHVFDGEADAPYVESSPTNPVNAYGRSKLMGESLALAQGALVVRTSWVISAGHRSFVARVLETAEQRVVRVVDDQVGCPTIADDLAVASIHALDRGVTGLLHLTNRGATTRFGLARAAIEAAGMDIDRVRPCASAEYSLAAARPRRSVLASERIDALGLEALPLWRESLTGMLGRRG